MDTEAIRAKWRAKLASTKADRVAVPAKELAAVLAAGCLEQFIPLRESLTPEGPSTVRMRPVHLQRIADYAEPNNSDHVAPPAVHDDDRCEVDDQSDAGTA